MDYIHNIYNFFEKRRTFFYLTLLVLVIALGLSAYRVNFKQDISYISSTEISSEKHFKVKDSNEINPDIFGSPIISAYNSKQIKTDSIVTLSIAIVIIVCFLLFTFRRKRSLPVIFAPVAFGGLFALALIYFIQGTISIIAVGTGSIVMGIALSYSIHVVTHSYYVSSPLALIKDIVSPLTVSSFTTIVAFITLTFTHSPLLKDFGLFAALTLTGTIIFCLIFLPHFLIYGEAQKSPVLQWKIPALDKNRWLVASVILIAIVCLFFSNKVSFNTDSLQLIYTQKNLVFYISSVLIFIALLISYGRIELALLAFIPMFISWFLILGLMAIFGLEFNLINTILSTFIFGIGNNFSIFILDGLLKKYRDGKDLLNEYKTAIFLSAFVILAGTGVLIFAKHPAMHSLALISVIGIFSVILVTFTIQPILFRLLISKWTQKGEYPYTFMGIINSIYAFTVFVSGCLTVQILILVLLPFSFKRKKQVIQGMTHLFMKVFLFLMPSVRYKRYNKYNEDFKKPAVIVANHSSFIDIIMMIGLVPKSLIITNRWVYNSPIFGAIVRYLDFQTVENGYENMLDVFSRKIEQGYSIIIFPEGTRSTDGEIKRFHKGAFYLAQKLQLDIIPIVLYGNGMISSKTQPFCIKRGICSYRILQRIAPVAFDDAAASAAVNTAAATVNVAATDTFDADRLYARRTKEVAALFRKEYANAKAQFNTPNNPYFFNTLIKNYIYKGPVLEWYMRIKIRMEETYKIFNKDIPKDATIVDVGCGYAPLSYALSLYSNERKIIGIDYDEEKIALASNCFSKNRQIQFIAADIADYEMPENFSADVFILNDVLHYLPYDKQKNVIHNCLQHLADNGFLIIRDSDTSDRERHKKTLRTEVFSTRIFKFNKTKNPLYFFSLLTLQQNAGENYTVEKKYDRHSSNTIYTIKRN